MLSDALLLNDDFDCDFAEFEMGLTDPLGSGALPAPFTIAAAMLERGFLRSATGGSEIWGVRKRADMHKNASRELHTSRTEACLLSACGRARHRLREAGEGRCPKTVDVQRCFEGQAKAGN